MPSSDTKTRILDSAESLFAARGFAGTSLREITREAEANVAAVHYHFGSKEELLRAVLARVVEPVNRERLRRLDRAEAAAGDAPATVEAILDAFITPDLHLIRDLGARGLIITRFLGRSYTEPSELVQSLLREQFGHLGSRFQQALGRALPQLPPDRVFERLMWVVAIVTYILAGTGPAAHGGELDDPDALAERLVAFAAAGMRSPLPRDSKGERS